MTCLTNPYCHQPAPPSSSPSSSSSQSHPISTPTPTSTSHPSSSTTTTSPTSPHQQAMPPISPTTATTTVAQILRINLNIRQYRTPAYRFTNYKASWAPVVKREFSSKRMDQAKFSQGMNVEYKPVGGRDSNTSSSTGRIERVLTEDTLAGSTGVNVKASEQNPRYEIKNNKTGKTSAVKEENILQEVPTD